MEIRNVGILLQHYMTSQPSGPWLARLTQPYHVEFQEV